MDGYKYTQIDITQKILSLKRQIDEYILAEQIYENNISVLRSDMDYGALECWAENNIGRQKQPCVFRSFHLF